MIENLRIAGVKMSRETKPFDIGSLPLQGKTFVLTGILSSFSRGDAELRIKNLGGKVTSTVTKNTDYLVVGKSPGSKLAAAEHLGTEVLDETAFEEMLDAVSSGVGV